MNYELKIAIMRALYGIEFCLKEYEDTESEWFKKRAEYYLETTLDLLQERDGVNYRIS